MKKSYCLTLILFFLLPALMFPQGATTGGITGNVVDVDGNPVLGAEVVILHVPTGTKITTLTRNNGGYSAPAVRVGGPYTIAVSFQGFKTEKKEDLTVKLGERTNVDFTLTLATVDAGEVVVTASTPIINPYRTGAAQNVAKDAIADLPSISRDLSSFTRLAPQFSSGEDSGSFSAAGRSPRYNNIQIDGAQNNDLFGLGNSGTPGGQTFVTPVSLDAIEEFQLILAPYDVRHGMFTGGGVNVVTKSGSNELHGSLYFYGRNESLVRKGNNDEGDLAEFPEFSESSFGLTFGGPLIKDKLFFFVSGERKKEKSQKDLNYVIDGSGSKTDYGWKDDAERLRSILQSKYGYDAGGYGPTSNDFDSSQFLVKLDWNINAKHRLTLRHNFVDAGRIILRRNVNYAYGLANTAYDMTSTTNSTVLQLNSTLGNTLFNELILNYTTIRDNRVPVGDDFPGINIRDSGLVAGSETYSTKNQLDQDLIEFTDNLTLFAGNHTFTVGTHNEFFSFYNVFVKRAFGDYYFQNMDDFEAGKAYRFRHNYSNTNDPNAPAEFSVAQLGFYAGDDWAVSPNFHLTLGVRVDVPVFGDKPGANPAVVEAFGIPTDHVPTGGLLFSPRLGFNFDVTGNKTTQIRGGIGIFSGRTPFVWLSNQYVNNGINLTEIYYTNYSGIDFNPDPYNQPQMSGATEINLHDKDYKFPQTLRTNIAIDQELPLGITGTVEFIYSKAINEISYQNINLQQMGTMPDGRPTYGHITNGSFWDTDWINSAFNNVIYLTNTNEGYNYSLSFQLRKNLSGGGMVHASYTNGMAKDLFSGTSSQAISNWGYNITAANPNEPNLSYSAHDIRHRIALAIIKKFNFVANAPTTVSLFYDGRSGRPYSSRYKYDANGDGRSNDSIYVPLNESDIILDSGGGSWEEFDAYIKADPALEASRGKIVPRNASRDPWYHRVDIKIAQQIPIPGMKGHSLSLTFDVENFLNMLNRHWGYYKYIQFDDVPLDFRGMNSDGKPVYRFIGNSQKDDARFVLNQEFSRWRAMLGIKYQF